MQLVVFFLASSEKVRTFALANELKIMENVRVNFTVPQGGGYPVATHTDDEVAAVVERVLQARTAEDERAELNRRWQHMKAHPDSTYSSQEVFSYLDSLA